MSLDVGMLRMGGEGSTVEHSLGTGVAPQQEAPMLAPQTIIGADFALNVNSQI